MLLECREPFLKMAMERKYRGSPGCAKRPRCVHSNVLLRYIAWKSWWLEINGCPHWLVPCAAGVLDALVIVLKGGKRSWVPVVMELL